LDETFDKPDFQGAFLSIASQIIRKICVFDVALVLQDKQSSELIVCLLSQSGRTRVGIRTRRELNWCSVSGRISPVGPGKTVSRW
jgi:hypothetical protein